MRKVFQKIITVLFTLTSIIGFAQVYPVQMTPVFNVPYSSRISDYATSMDVKMQLLVNPSDITITNRQVRLKMYLQGNNLNAQSSDNIIGMNPIYINGGELLTLTNLELAPLFRLENLQGISSAQYANSLPEGMYSVCFEMYDFSTNQRISQKSCANLYLMLNDPPLLNTPARNESIAVSEFPNILFTWTPRQINATNVSYQFELKEILDPTIDPQIGFLTSPVLYQEELYSTALLYDLSKPNLLPGKRYAWRVKAVSTSGLSQNNVFKNDGYSEIYHFTYASNCPAPTYILSEALSARSVKISWLGNDNHTKYHVQYRKANVAGAEWFEVYTMNTQTTISDLEAGITYEFRVGGSCEPAVLGNTTSFTYSGINQFSMPAAGNSNSTFTCGLGPTVSIANQTPITNLIVSETFTAGDFPVKILELTGNSPYTGKGYIIVPYLADTKIAVIFNNITVNTNYQLINGIVETSYNPNWTNLMDVDVEIIEPIFDPLIEEIFGPQTGDYTSSNTDNSPNDNDSSDTDILNGDNSGNTNSQTDNPDEGDSNVNNENTDVNNEDAENNSTTFNNDSNGTDTTGNDYFIEYKNKKYYTGGKIKIPYKRNMFETFEMKTLSNEARVSFTIHEPGKQEMWRGYDGYTTKQTLPIEERRSTLVNLYKMDLESEATNVEGKPKVRIEIEKIVDPFIQNGLTATDISNKKRVAKAGEILYYINKPTVSTETRHTEFKAILSQPDIQEIPLQNLKWKIDGRDDEYKNGESKFDVYINENKTNTTVTNTAGYPDLTTKEVKVKWVDESRGEVNFMPPAVSHTIQQLCTEILVPLKKVADEINDFLGTDKFKAEIKPIKIKGESYNEIDKNTRHYLKVTKGSINGGLAIKGEFLGYPPFLKFLNIDDISKVGLYVTPKVEFNLIGGAEKKIIGENNNTINDDFYVEGNLKGCIELGLKAELLVAKEYVDFSVNGFGEACGSGKIIYNITQNRFIGKIYLDPIKLGVKAKIKSNGAFSFTLVDVDKSWSITDKTKIYDSE